MDQWQLEELAKVLSPLQGEGGDRRLIRRRCCVSATSSRPTSVEQAVADSLAEYGPSAKVAVIPKGPYVLPYVA